MELNEGFDGLSFEIASPSSASVPTRWAIIVAGSHRSGTSALARVLNLVGCDLPRHVLPRADDNELGFWEPEMVARAHDVFLESIGSSWDDVAALPDGAFVSGAARELRQQLTLLLHEEYGDSSLFVVKDPRISRLVPLWLAVLPELQITPAFALAVRNPLEVAASLKARDGFTTTKSLLLWLRHTIESEQHSRGRPRSFVLYDELLQNWQGVVARAEEDLGVTWPGRSHRATVEIEHFVSDRQRHHVFDWRDIEGRADVVSWVKEAYFALRGSDPAQVLDQVRDELARADIAFGPILEEARFDFHASQEQLLQAAAARDTLGEDLDARSLALEERGAEVQRLQEDLGELRNALSASASRASVHEAEVAALEAERGRLAHEVERFGEEAGQLSAAAEAAQARVDAAAAETASTREELGAAYAEVDRLRAAAGEAVARAAALEAESSAVRGSLLMDLDTARTTIEQLEERAVSTTTALSALEAQAGTERGRMLADLDAANADVATLEAERARLAHEVERSGEEAIQLSAAVETAQARVDAAAAETDSTREELSAAYAEVGRLRVEAGEAVAHAASLEAQSSAERENLLTDLHAARTSVGQLEERVVSTNAALAALEAQAASDRAKLLQELTEARADGERLAVRILEAESERGRMLADLGAANTEANRLAKQLEDKLVEGQELAATADELLFSADAELEASRAERDRLQAEIADAIAEHGRLLTVVEHLEDALESTTAALGEHEQTAAAVAKESAIRRAELDAELAHLLHELETARTDLENARSEIELVHDELEIMKSGAASERAAFSAEHDAARTEQDRLVEELATARAHAAAHTAELEAAVGAHKALLNAFQSVTNRRTSRRRTLSQLGTWLLPPTPRKLSYLRRYVALRRSGELDVDSYLLANPDVLAAGINPLMHYVQYGRGEGRAVAGYIDPPKAAGAIEVSSSAAGDIDVSSSDAVDLAIAQVLSPAEEEVSPGAEERDDDLDRNTDVQDSEPDPVFQVQTIETPGPASSVDDLIGAAFPLLRPLRVFPTPAKQGRRLNLVTDSLNEGSLFGGVGTSIVLASLLAQRLDASLRIVTRLVPPNPANFGVVQRSHEIKFDGNVEFAYAPIVGDESLPLHDRDLFLTTSWWSTWSTIRAVSPERIVYLIQEDERMFYPAGDEQAACSETIADSRIRFVVNTAMLNDHLVQEGFSNVGRQGISFEPAFPAKLYFREARPVGDSRRTFFFYARPNNVRNLFLRGLAAIDEAVSANIIDPADWNLHFVGSGVPSIQLSRGVTPVVSENLPWPDYAALVRGVDLGLSLMSTPHPSYPPLDLAACGAVAVTNRCGVKQDLNTYSSNIICSDLGHDAIVKGIAEGVKLAQDRETRQRNYENQRLSRSWDSSLSAVLDELSDWA